LRLKGADQYGKLIHNPLRRLADLLGHSHIATTFLYLDFVEQCESVVDDAIAEWAREIP
jgi:site-specific recombinase XerC